MINEHFYNLQEAKDMKVKSARLEELETPRACAKSFTMNDAAVTAKCKAEPQIPRERKKASVQIRI